MIQKYTFWCSRYMYDMPMTSIGIDCGKLNSEYLPSSEYRGYYLGPLSPSHVERIARATGLSMFLRNNILYVKDN